jgi:TPR repeat protein
MGSVAPWNCWSPFETFSTAQLKEQAPWGQGLHPVNRFVPWHGRCLREGGSGIFKAIHLHPCSPIKLEGLMHDLMMTAVQGDADAAYQLGFLYDTGDGVPQDEKEALRWYLMGAQKGHSKAQFNLAVMLEEGRGQVTDLRKAFFWYEKAAQQGESNAQYNLALFCTWGKGCEVDLVLAHMWFTLAARKGNSDAIHKRDAVAKQLKAEQLALSQQWVAQWIEKNVVV